MREIYRFIATNCAVAGLFASCLLASVAQAQQAVLQEVIVTATKRATDIQDVPFSIQAITGQDLERMGANDFDDYARQIAGLSLIEMGQGGPKLTLRGLSTTQFNETQDTVGIYIDETPVISAGGAAPAFLSSYDLQIFDIARVEVLRGPQGTLFGAGSMGGTIRIITKQPDASKFDGAFQSELSNIENGGTSYNFKVMGNAPLTNDLAARAVAYYKNDAGYIDNPVRQISNINDQQATGGRLALRYTPYDQLSITATAAVQRRTSGGWSVETVGARPFVQTNAGPETFSDLSSQYNFLVSYDLSFAQLVSSSTYVDRAFDVLFDISPAFGSLLPPGEFGEQNSNTAAQTFVQEVRLASKSESAFQWLVGGFYFHQHRNFSQHIPLVQGLPYPLYNLLQSSTGSEYAAFGELSYRFGNKLTATVGARTFRDKLDFIYVQSGFFAGGTSGNGGSGTDRGTTPKFNLAYSPTPHVLAYLDASKGYRRGDLNVIAPQQLCGADLNQHGFPNGSPPTFHSDSLWNYELGLKSETSDHKFFLNVDGYYIDWKDLPVTVILNCGFTFNVNAGKARTIGSEIEAGWRPSDRFELSGTYAYTSAELTSPVASLNAVPGDKAPGVPQNSGSLSATYTFPIDAATWAFARADLQYVGSSWNLYNRSDPLANKMSSYSLGNVRFGIRKQRWEVAAFVKNVTNKVADLNFINQSFGQLIVVNQPRTVGLSVSYQADSGR